jgi:hypothetical protein
VVRTQLYDGDVHCPCLHPAALLQLKQDEGFQHLTGSRRQAVPPDLPTADEYVLATA